MDEYRRRVALLRDNMRAKAITYNWHDPDTSYIEAVLARGDRRLGAAIEQVWRTGGRLDSWEECFSFDRWISAIKAVGLDPDFYTVRERTKDELLPWSVTSVGVRPEYLWRERERAYEGVITPDCRANCTGCGANKLLAEGKCDE